VLSEQNGDRNQSFEKWCRTKQLCIEQHRSSGVKFSPRWFIKGAFGIAAITRRQQSIGIAKSQRLSELYSELYSLLMPSYSATNTSL
jgi:hypothetical protein